MRDPRKQQQQPGKDGQQKWEANEEIHEREVGGEEDEPPEEETGCFKIKRLKGQLRLPVSFTRATSLPKRFGRSVTPIPPAARDPLPQNTSHNESGHLSVGGSMKRAASTSPSRNEFRRSLKDRLPRKLRSLLSTRGSRSSKLPPKPSRKSGPVGRTWVKVYDDITYMDDSEQEYYPVVSYTGSPFRIPDAQPLPTPPTPPPPRQALDVARAITPTPSQISEYDNVMKEEIMSEIETAKKQYLADSEPILHEMPNKKLNENLEDEDSVRPTARRKDNSRFKGRRQKRSGTPIATDRITNGFHTDLENTIADDTFENIMYDHGQNERKPDVVEDDYIVPEQSPAPPARPKRGTKNYEFIEPRGTSAPVSAVQQEITVVEKSNVVETPAKYTVVKEDISTEIADQPARPVRGIKIYESIQLPLEVEIVSQDNTDTKEVIGQDTKSNEVDETPKTIDVVDSSSVKVTTPARPKRGTKLYEDVIPEKESEAINENVCTPAPDTAPILQLEDAVSAPAEPNKPCRGTKLYSSMKFENKDKKETELTKEQIASSETATTENVEIPMQTNSFELVTQQDLPEKNIPRYAKVHKGKDNQLIQLDKCAPDSPPPIPPKKRGRRAEASNTIDEQVPSPPRPHRNLKPLATSAEAVSAPKRRKTEASATTNGYIDSSEIDKDSPPKKPTRGSQNKASAPPRRKKNAAGDPLIARMIIETGKVPQVSFLPEDAESYENVTLQGEQKINFRTRPLPPTPVSNTTRSVLECTQATITTETITNASTVVREAVCNVSAEGAESSNNSVHVSDASDAVASGYVGAGASVSGLEKNLEQDIDVNIDNIESSFATFDTVLKSLQMYSGLSLMATRKLDETEEIPKSEENKQAICTQSRKSGCPTSDKNADHHVTTANDRTFVANAQQVNTEQVKQDIDCEKLEGELKGESISQGLISPECVQKATVVTTADITNVAAAATVPAAAAADSSAGGVKPAEQLIITSAVQVPETISAVTLTVEVVESVNESVTVQDIPESISVSSQIVFPRRKLSIAAENITTEISETLITNDGISSSEVSDATSSTALAQNADANDGDRKISVAAETVVLEFMPETTKSITETGTQTESFSAFNEIPESLSIPAQVVTQGRKLSIGAENLTTDFSEMIVVADGTVASSADAAAVAAKTSPEEGGRKLSVAAETIVLEFVPETARTIADTKQSESVSIVPSNEADAVSVAAVTVTVGEFADTVTNTTNDATKIGSVATESVETGELAEPQQILTENIDTRSSSEAHVSTDEIISNESFEGKTSTTNSLEGSQTSITDEDSVVSVVTKEELANRDEASTVESRINPSSTLEENPVDAAEPPVKESSDLKDGMTDINARLEVSESPVVVESLASCEDPDPASITASDQSAPSHLNDTTDSAQQAQAENIPATPLTFTSALVEQNVECQEQKSGLFLTEVPSVEENLPVHNSRETNICDDVPSTTVRPDPDSAPVAVKHAPPILKSAPVAVKHAPPILKSALKTLPTLDVTQSVTSESPTATYVVVTREVRPEPTVFTLLNRGIGLEGPRGQEYVSVYIKGEWKQM